MAYFFTSESVSEGHPDKVADQVSDALIDHFLAFDSTSKVACETLVTTGQVVLAGEVKSSTYLDVQKIARETINKIGYTKGEYMFDGNSCGVLSAIHEQSPDINQGVERANLEDQGAGDQGMMFGYATNETESYMPLPLELSHLLLKELAKLRRENKDITYLRPDSKSQVTIKYDDNNKPIAIDAIVVSTQHDDFDTEEAMLSKIKSDVINILVPRVVKQLPSETQVLFTDSITYHVNPTGIFVIGGPHGDTGLTGRKIIVDTYGGKGAHGGGAFSGKDPSKVDRSAAYATRHIAKNLVAAGIADEALVQVAYAIGVAEPMGLYVNTYGTSKVSKSDGEIADILMKMPAFDMRPYFIENRFNLRTPIYSETAAYGHMGRTTEVVTKQFTDGGGNT
ncbi:MAG: methionine adenosyltransferase, partial [Bacteroidia bacterium]|nr:methionine adenosyltransferase [Bacteroidia bacterium]